jgi:shikimate kinase
LLTLRVISLDAELVRRAGKSVPEIVAERGWPGFRDLEEQVVADAARLQGYVIDCGGGVVEREANFPVLRAAGRVIWLTARPDTIVRRIGGDTQRPSLTGQKSFTEEVVEVLTRREPLYRRLAHAVVATDDRSLGAITADVVREARS